MKTMTMEGKRLVRFAYTFLARTNSGTICIEKTSSMHATINDCQRGGRWWERKQSRALLVLAFFLLFSTLKVIAQPHAHGIAATGGQDFRHFRVSMAIYHTYIGTKTSEGRGTLIVPSLGLDIEYWFNEKWGIGSHNDLEMISFEVEKGTDLFLERETPLLLTVDALWKPWKGLVLSLGPGVEFERHENLFVVRAGLEYEFDLKSHWDIAPILFYDNRKNAYDTFSMGIGIGKRF